MPKSFSEDLKQKWKESIQQQRNSGLSISAWCRQNKILPHNFHYWQRKLFSKPPLKRLDFSEVIPSPEPSNSGVILEYRDFHIHLSPSFDATTLSHCLEVLKKC